MIDRKLIKQSVLAGIFSIITIGILTILTYKTSYGIFLIASFGSTMVLLYGYPESPFAQPKNIISVPNDICQIEGGGLSTSGGKFDIKFFA